MSYRIQPLNQSEFKMKIIKDLEMVASKTNPKKFNRHAIFECTSCKEHFEARATGKAAKNQTTCINCAGKHKLSTHPLYAIWNSIKQRCYNPKRKDYHKYGGKGVTMYEPWINDVTAFIEWSLANGWKSGLVIDKDIKSKELGIVPIYSPDTLSFITTKENAYEANAKKVAQYTIDGDFIQEFISCVEAAEYLGKPYSFKTNIASCCRGINHTAGGFKWKYI